MKIILIDNNDSFTYNLLHLIRAACAAEDQVEVCMSENFEVRRVADFDRIVISPGPGVPSEIEVLGKSIKMYQGQIPILGICLGHQAIAETYGATLRNMKKPVHGIISEIRISDNSRLFRGLGAKITAGRYHSWCVSRENFPDCLAITAEDPEGNIMALSHREYDIHGVQFHPESFMTDTGKIILSNFLNGTQK